MHNLFWIFIGLTALLALLTLLPLSRHEAWWVRGADFPRLQLAALATVSLALQAGIFDWSLAATWVMAGITLVCLVYQSWWILPNTMFFPKEVKTAGLADQQNTIRIMSVNVLTPNPHTEKLLTIVKAHRPDVLIAVETDRRWQTALDTLQADYPYSLKCPLDNLYGMHLYSRLPLHDGKIQFLVEPDLPSFHVAVELLSGRMIRMHCLHPAPPSPTENAESTERDAELIIVARTVAESDLPVIVAGDLNDVAWSATTRLFRKISGLLDPRVGRGMYNTFHANHFFLRWPLDHLFHSDHFAVSRLQRLPRFGSDHFPILVELVLVENLQYAQQGLAADADDEAWARENAAEAGVHKDQVHTPGQ